VGGEGLQDELAALTLGTVAHELGHICERRPPYFNPELPASPARRNSRASVLRQAVALHPDSGFDLPNRPPWEGHDHQWLRLAIQISQRIAELTGVEIHWRQVVGWQGVPAWELARAMGNEPRRLRNITVEQLKRRSMPRPYRRLWAEIYTRHL